MENADSSRNIYTVTELNGSVRLLLSSHFGTIWVEGEISNLSQPSSGHLYFTLKDRDAQARCALFRGSARTLGFRPANGMQVLVRAQVSLYESRGDFQLVVDYMEEAGDGALRRAYEALKFKLASEGMFDAARKRPIPVPPKTLGVITSPTGAAIRDILTVLKRRFPALPVIVFPVKVQGAEAGKEIARAISLADRLKLCDALLLARGGGSLEDLWAFNEEAVARAMAACSIPIVSGVGHETDTTIADLVADMRAPTPSAAAEALSPDGDAWLAQAGKLEGRLYHRLRALLDRREQTLAYLQKRLQQAHPQRQMQRNAQRLDELELRLNRAILNANSRRQARLHTLMARLQSRQPAARIGLLSQRHGELKRRLYARAAGMIELRKQTLAAAAEKLQLMSPLATLERGYAIASRSRDGKILRDSGEIQVGESVEIRLSAGALIGQVTGKRSPEKP